MRFPEAIGRTIARNSLHLRKASPEVLLGVGIVGMVGSTVLACRATLKAEEVMDEAKSKLMLVKTLEHDDYSEKDRSRDVSLVYFQTSVKMVKLYAPAIIVGAASIYCLRTSHGILTRRNIALTAAYGALEKGFEEYRARVVDRYGEDVDRELRYGTRVEEIIDEETNKPKMVTRVGFDIPSVYARFFDPASPSWSRDPEHNLFFLRSQQNWCNDLLRSRGHLFLNEVYDLLGIPRTKAGAVVGWVWTPDDKSKDNYVNFGVFDGRTQQARDFVNGPEGSILLDFNVDGVIYDKLGE